MEFYELKNKIIDQGKETHFFDADTLRFFGERLSEMRVLKNTVEITDVCDNKHTCYCIAAKRRKNWNGPSKPYTHYHYFDVETFQHVTN